MKPLTLQFTAFGSYPGTESIDFASLAPLGLYVVTGPTGSGKTTIFDAMAYALYGEVPGEREKGDVRSQHAEPEAVCSVTFRFAIDGVVYRVTRTPEQFKPRERGLGDPVKVTAKANLVREADEFALESGLTKVTKACIDLVGLDAAQFERVVLLPQGQFQKFLLANTAERLPLLSQLFGTARWVKVVDELKVRASEARIIVGGIEEQLGQYRFAIDGALKAARVLAHDWSNSEDQPNELFPSGVGSPASPAFATEPADDTEVGLEFFTEQLAALDEQTVPLKSGSEVLGQLATAAEKSFNEATAIVENWDKRTELRAQRKLLDEQMPEILDLRTRRDSARVAEPVLRAFTDEQRDLAAHQAARAVQATAMDALGKASADAGLSDASEGEVDPDALALSVAAARSVSTTRHESISQLATVSAGVADNEKRVEELTLEADVLTVRAADVDEQIASHHLEIRAFEALASTESEWKASVEASAVVVSNRRELDSVLSRIPVAEQLKVAATDRQLDAVRRFDEAAAPRLAEALAAGVACPVCGSEEHPSPAIATGEAPVDSHDRDAATSALVAAAMELMQLQGQSDDLATVLGADADRTLTEVEAVHEHLEAEHLAATKAVGDLDIERRQLERAIAEKGTITEHLGKIALDLAGLRPQIDSGKESIEALRAGLGEYAETWDADPGAAVEALKAMSAALDRVENGIASCRTAAQTVISSEVIARAAAVTLVDVLAASPFASREAAQAAALTPDRLGEVEAFITEFEGRDAKNRAVLDENLKLELPAERPDATDLQIVAAQERSAATKAADSWSRIAERLEQARSDLKAALVIEAGSSDAITRSQSLQALARTCDGNGQKKISLETWVLAGELERVASAANHHLERMTSGRYRIERSDESGHAGRQSGLDLRVLDAHTGNSRRPGSLSGGEQFQASLALALGLADVIGHGGNANGRVFEALFVDEGFGALDPDSLDQAVEALMQIQAAGRTVGVITHVEAMKDTIDIGIRVDRLPGDRGSTLTVLPSG